MILVWWMRQDVTYYLSRAQVQASIDPDEGKSTQSAWQEYTDAFFPYLKGQRKRHDKAAMDYLMREVKKGGLRVRPTAPTIKSKLHKMRRKEDEHPNYSTLPGMRFGKGPRRRR